MLTYIDYEGSDYDYLLDQYQVGMNQAKYDEFFGEIKEKIVPLIHAIKERGRQIDASALAQNFPVEGQKAFTEVLKEALNMDSDKVLVMESVHPFCSFFSANDVRFTTKYLEDNLASAILSTAHEYGHALYGLQVNPSYEKTEFGRGIGLAMHESQSRTIENYVGRNPGFWKKQYPKLQELFPAQLCEVSLDQFLDIINVSVPGFIRIEADELTYPLHVLIRYEIEKMIFDGEADFDTLDVLWADKYEEYLGIRPVTHSEGILQDIHWSWAYFGYFPTYALGSAFASQFYAKMAKDIDVDAILEKGEFEPIAVWLKENIHHYGASKTYDEILLAVTGENFNPSYYTDYLVEKYTKLYQI